MTNEEMIERAAKAAVREVKADPLILPEVISRLRVYHDGARHFGRPNSKAVLGSVENGGRLTAAMVVDQVRSDLRFTLHHKGGLGKHAD